MKKLYVGNLPFQATEEDVGNWFTQVGVTPANVTLVRDRFSGQPRGFGFVEVNSDDDAGRAIQALNGHDFMGRNVVVNEARPPREGGGGGGGGRARRRRRWRRARRLRRWRSRWRRRRAWRFRRRGRQRRPLLTKAWFCFRLWSLPLGSCKTSHGRERATSTMSAGLTDWPIRSRFSAQG